jgi:phosphomannomutase
MTDLPPDTDEPIYRCPGQSYSISRAVHLGRLARFYPPCRECPHQDDTGTLPARVVEQLIETRRRAQASPWFTAEGAAGVCPNDLGPEAVRMLAVAFGLREFRRRREPGEAPVILLGGDGRSLTAELVAVAGEALRWAGCHMVDIGAVTSACMAFALDHWQASGGILVGNPDDRPQTAGLKFWSDGPHPLSAGEGLDELEAICREPVDRPTRTFGSRRRFAADEPYLAALAEHYHALRPLRFVLHTACLPAGIYVRKLTSAVACEALVVTTGVEGLADQILAEKAHFGLHVGDDGEIAWLFDERGREVSADRLLLLLARHRLADRPGGTIVLEAGTSASTAEVIAMWGGRVVEASCVRAVMEQTMRQTGALLGGGPTERIWHNPGHATPDALRTLTAVLVSLSRSDRRLSEVLDAETRAS